MSTKSSDLRCDFHNRVARLNEQAALRAQSTPDAAPVHSLANAETAEELRSRIKTTLSTDIPRPAEPRRRLMGFPVIVATLVIAGSIFWLQSPAQEVASALQSTGSARALLPGEHAATAGETSFKSVTAPRQ